MTSWNVVYVSQVALVSGTRIHERGTTHKHCHLGALDLGGGMPWDQEWAGQRKFVEVPLFVVSTRHWQTETEDININLGWPNNIPLWSLQQRLSLFTHHPVCFCTVCSSHFLWMQHDTLVQQRNCHLPHYYRSRPSMFKGVARFSNLENRALAVQLGAFLKSSFALVK